jgi:hypothetical protein
MDDCGIADTNRPEVKLLWERDAAEVRLALAVEPEPPSEGFRFTLPGDRLA